MEIKSLKTKGKVTSSAVAELAGVSRSAVSRTFSGGTVSQATREKVLKAAEELGYEENRLAKGLIEGKVVSCASLLIILSSRGTQNCVMR